MIPAVDQNHLFRNSGELQGIGSRRVTAANNGHRLSPVGHSITRCAVVDAPANQISFSCGAKRSGSRAGRNHNGPGKIPSLAGLKFFHPTAERCAEDLCNLCLRAKFFRSSPHPLAQSKAINALFKAGVIVNLLAQCHLSPCGQLFQY